jgi:hypothetical protein
LAATAGMIQIAEARAEISLRDVVMRLEALRLEMDHHLELH